jgi:small GTP-binding protein
MSEGLDAKVVFLGAASVGKTCIICRAVSDKFYAEMPNTIGACFIVKEVTIANTTVALQIWDTAGQERFRTLAPMYYRGSVIALLVYSVNDGPSLQDVKKWAEEMKIQTDEMPMLFVVGNKCDLVNERIISTEQGSTIAKELGAFFCEVSAMSGAGIDELFMRVAEEAIKRLKGDTDNQEKSPTKIELMEETCSKKKKKRAFC